ncbi:MAG: hypothetical protein MR645_07100 [Paraprevotella sp.]|nr:hypothetical protein [Paraprevotella sp.]
MKKYLLLIIALCYTVMTNAQGTDKLSAVLQHGNDVSVYDGATGFQQAYAAAADGDVIILSQGVFQTVSRIEKSLTILGAGFEDNAETNTATTTLNGNVLVGKADGVLDGFRIEGVKINGIMEFQNEMKNTNILKSYISGEVRIKKNIETMTFKQCHIGGSVLGETNVVAKGLLFANCYVDGNARTFSYESTVNIDHCYVAQYGNNDRAQILITNTIIGGDYFSNGSGVAPYSILKNCIVSSSAGNFPSTALIGTYYKVDLATIFADANNTSYSEARTFKLQDEETYKGNDGTPIGPSGGAGWNKVPSRPYVSNLSATPSGTNLNVTYETNVK